MFGIIYPVEGQHGKMRLAYCTALTEFWSFMLILFCFCSDSKLLQMFNTQSRLTQTLIRKRKNEKIVRVFSIPCILIDINSNLGIIMPLSINLISCQFRKRQFGNICLW